MSSSDSIDLKCDEDIPVMLRTKSKLGVVIQDQIESVIFSYGKQELYIHSYNARYVMSCIRDWFNDEDFVDYTLLGTKIGYLYMFSIYCVHRMRYGFEIDAVLGASFMGDIYKRASYGQVAMFAEEVFSLKRMWEIGIGFEDIIED